MAEELHFGHMGNGITVWDSSREINHEYPTVAHIAYDRSVTYYEDVSPEARQRIEHFALYENMDISQTQSRPALQPNDRIASRPNKVDDISTATESEYLTLVAAIKLRHSERIAAIDADPDQWYELFVNEGEAEGSYTVESGDTFDEAVTKLVHYAKLYGLDNVFLDVWTERESPQDMNFGFWSADTIYEILYEYFTTTGRMNKMKMVRTATYPQNGSKPTFTKENRGEGLFFADEIAFRYFRDRICFIPEYSEPSDPQDKSNIIGTDQGYTRADLVAMCGGNEEKAAKLFGLLDWRSPETLLNDWDDYNE